MGIIGNVLEQEDLDLNVRESRLVRDEYVIGLGKAYVGYTSWKEGHKLTQRVDMSLPEVTKSFEVLRTNIENSLNYDFKKFFEEDKARYEIQRLDGSTLKFDLKSYGEHFVKFTIIVESNTLGKKEFAYLYKYRLEVGEGTPFGYKYEGRLENLAQCIENDVTRNFLKRYNEMTPFELQKSYNNDRLKLSVVNDLKKYDFKALQNRSRVMSLVSNRYDVMEMNYGRIAEAPTFAVFTGDIEEIRNSALNGKDVVQTMNAMGLRRIDYGVTNKWGKGAIAILKALVQGVIYSPIAPSGFSIANDVISVTNMNDGNDAFNNDTSLMGFSKGKKAVDVISGKILPSADFVGNVAKGLAISGAVTLPAAAFGIILGVGMTGVAVASLFSLLQSYYTRNDTKAQIPIYYSQVSKVSAVPFIPQFMKDYVGSEKSDNDHFFNVYYYGINTPHEYLTDESKCTYHNTALNTYRQSRDSYYDEMEKAQRKADAKKSFIREFVSGVIRKIERE